MVDGVVRPRRFWAARLSPTRGRYSLITPRIEMTVFLIVSPPPLICCCVALGPASSLRKGHTDTVPPAMRRWGRPSPRSSRRSCAGTPGSLRRSWGAGYLHLAAARGSPCISCVTSRRPAVSPLRAPPAHSCPRRCEWTSCGARQTTQPAAAALRRATSSDDTFAQRAHLLITAAAAGLRRPSPGLIARGTVVVENAFSLYRVWIVPPQAVGQKDVPVVQAISPPDPGRRIHRGQHGGRHLVLLPSTRGSA